MVIHCPVCRMPATATVAVCDRCDTPHHSDCWEFGAGCAIFACGGNRARVMDAAACAAVAPAVLHIDGSVPEPARPCPAPPASGLPPPASRDHPPVVAVSWLYLAVSLLIAIPAPGYLVRAVTHGAGGDLAGGIAAALAALSVKVVGDLIAVGDPRGRAAHLWMCVIVGLALCASPLSLIAVALAVPFWTRRGRAHFGL